MSVSTAVRWATGLCLIAAGVAAAAFLGARWATRDAVTVPTHTPSVERGAYLFAAASCQGCHTADDPEAPLLGGGRALATPFGTFYGPNITPDPEHGIGLWDDADFIRAMRQGVSPDGADYYPVFPYGSFTRITDEDLLDLKAYIFSLPPAATANRPHDIGFPFGFRPVLAFWKLLNLDTGPEPAQPGLGEEEQRGAYLVRALGHCGECHTPRDAIGAPVADRTLAGTEDGPEGKPVPNITPDPETGIGNWRTNDIVLLLKSGMAPDGDFVGSGMGEVVENSTSHLTQADLEAIAAYLQAVPAVVHRVGSSRPDERRSTDDW